MTRCIDAHHHFWQYSAAEYEWITEQMLPLRRDFLPSDLQTVMTTAGVKETIAVQARQTIEETKWLLRLAHEHAFIAGVVGWAPLTSSELPCILETLAPDPKLKGIRHVLQAEPDSYMLHEDFHRGIAALAGTGLVYDILIYARQLPSATQLVDRHPHQIFVLDHIAKPGIHNNQLSPWSEQLQELAKRQNVYCKLSGMVTEADWHRWTIDGLRPFFDSALQSFGPQRLLAGSDWPVCTVAASYEKWWSTLRELISALSSAEQESILGRNAATVYRLEEGGR